MNTSDLGNSIMTVRYKIVFVGDVGVGKTSIMNRFITDQFTDDYDVTKIIYIIIILYFYKYQSTIGVDFATKTIEYKDNSVKLQMWDSAGLERYRALIPSYVRGAALIFIIYDISSKDSFINLQNWINFIKQVNTDNAMIVLCGNKIDLERRVTTQEGKTLANKEQMLFFEVSAKNGEYINKMMYSAIAELPFFEQYNEGNKDELVKELEGVNYKKSQNSIYDIVKEPDNNNKPTLTVTAENENKDKNAPEVIVIRRKPKKKCCQICNIFDICLNIYKKYFFFLFNLNN